METQNKPAVKEKTTVKTLFQQNNIRTKFEEMMGKRASQFITSVLQIATTSLPKDVDPLSVYNAAAVAATLDLPLNNNLGFAYIVPYNEKYQDPNDGKWKKKAVAQFQMGYKGFKQLAMRSGQFERLNTTDVREGELLNHNRLTGEITFNWIQDFTAREEKKVIGYLSYFRLLNGFEQTFYMPIEKIEAHAKKYSQSYSSKTEYVRESSRWTIDFNGMAEKTVTKLNLSKNAPLSIEMQKAILVDQSVIKNEDGTDVTYIDVENVITKPTQEEIELDRQKQMIEDCKTLEELMDLQTKYPDWDSSLYTDKKQKLIQVAK